MPALILVSETRCPELLDEFGRYARDYDLHTATSVAEAEQVAARRRARRGPGGDVRRRVAAARRVRARGLRPVARRSCRPRAASSRRTGRRSSPTRPRLRAGLAKGKYDAYLLMPRGVRDEEFHTAICELLSDWGSTVAEPEVVTVAHRLARGGRPDPGHPRLPRPDGPAQPRLPARERRRAGRCSPRGRGRRAASIPLVEAMDKRPTSPRSRARRRDAHLRAARRHRRRPGRRRRHRRRRTGRARGRRLRLVRGPDHGRAGGGGGRRPGGHVVDDPQLPRLPARHLRYAARPAGAQPGDPLRHPLLHRLAGHLISSPASDGRAARAAHRGRRRARPGGRRLGRREVSPPPGARHRARSSVSASSTAAP